MKRRGSIGIRYWQCVNCEIILKIEQIAWYPNEEPEEIDLAELGMARAAAEEGWSDR